MDQRLPCVSCHLLWPSQDARKRKYVCVHSVYFAKFKSFAGNVKQRLIGCCTVPPAAWPSTLVVPIAGSRQLSDPPDLNFLDVAAAPNLHNGKNFTVYLLALIFISY